MARQLPAVVLLLLTTLGVARAQDAGDRCCVHKIRVGGPIETVGAKVNFDQVDHSTFDGLLHRFVDCDGYVCYRRWKADCCAMGQLHDYLIMLGQVDTKDEKASKEGELAYYINAYNALVLWGILDQYPTPSIQRHNQKDACFRIFDDLEMWIDGEYLSLNSIEHDILRGMGEPRIHFALVCAAKGCPRLRNEAYDASRLEEQLTTNSIDFFDKKSRFNICRPLKVVKLSPILKWFREDFGETDHEALNVVYPYLPCKDQRWLSNHPCPKIKHLGYNWALNDQCPTLRVRLGSIPYGIYAKFEPCIRPFLPKPEESAASEEEAPADSELTEEVETVAEPQPPRPLPAAPRSVAVPATP